MKYILNYFLIFCLLFSCNSGDKNFKDNLNSNISEIDFYGLHLTPVNKAPLIDNFIGNSEWCACFEEKDLRIYFTNKNGEDKFYLIKWNQTGPEDLNIEYIGKVKLYTKDNKIWFVEKNYEIYQLEICD